MKELLAISYIVMLFSFFVSTVFSGDTGKRNIKIAVRWQFIVFLISCFFFIEMFDAIYNLGITVDNRELQILYRVTFSWIPILALMRLRRLRMLRKMER